MRKIILLLVMLLLVQINAQEATLTPLSEDAVIEHASTEWEANYRYTDPGAVIYHDGQFHMFRNAFSNWPASVEIAYMTSDDGVEWTEMSDEPVLTSDDVAYAKVAVLASSVVVEEDGTWVLYFYTWNGRNYNIGNGEIGRATASDPLGPWTVGAEPVLSFGDEGSWDEQMVNAPSVIRTDDGYIMYYSGYDNIGMSSGKIGMATSEDGIEWEKLEEPILVATEDWEGDYINQPRVEPMGEGWIMFYRAFGNPPRDMKLAIATSKDGIMWEKAEDNPVFIPSDVPNQVALWFHETTYYDETYYVFVELSDNPGSGTTDIFALTYSGG